MKKIMFALTGMALVCACSCNKSADSASEAVEMEETTEVAVPEKKVEIDPYIAKLMQNDTTIMVTETGLGYKVIKQGDGSRPTKQNAAKVIYTGKHKDGSEFDSSVGKGDGTVEFPLVNVVPGFAEGICLMPVGSKYELYIPGNLGYGPSGTPGGPIGPNELLIFEVELLDFK